MLESLMEWADFVSLLPAPVLPADIDTAWMAAVRDIKGKILVLDDDPTGIQTVHGVPVYTSWEPETLLQIMKEKSKVVYILTNSRALTADITAKLHRSLAQELKRAARECGEEFLVISRSDSTLRGHYPLETQALREGLGDSIDGEIIVPFFLEGGRLTWQDIHYVKEGNRLTPAGLTEFARDATFGYKSSDLKEWIEEKTAGLYPAGKVVSISLDELRNKEIQNIVDKLINVTDFNKIIVNAVEYSDLKVFMVCLAQALKKGRCFLYRTAASFVQVIGGISPRPLLDKKSLYPGGKPPAPGLIIAGSYVQKTTRQLERLRELDNLAWVEWNVKQAESDSRMKAEVERAISEVEKAFKQGSDVCVFTSRNYFHSNPGNEKSEKNLVFSTRVSRGLVEVVQGLAGRPGFLVGKGGITSSDIGVQGLGVKKAMVMGQIQPGVPVWELGPESRFPGLPYVIFPGNVGTEDTLKNVVEILRQHT